MSRVTSSRNIPRYKPRLFLSAEIILIVSGDFCLSYNKKLAGWHANELEGAMYKLLSKWPYNVVA